MTAMAKKKIILAGGSGFLGKILGSWFAERGYEVVVFSRGHLHFDFGRCVNWDGESLGDWAGELDGVTALINLAGRTVNCRYHARNRRKMMNSRVLSTRVLGKAIQKCCLPPQVWLNSSTATIYMHTYGKPHGEEGELGAEPEAKDRFSIEVATAWEDSFKQIAVPRVRKVILRMAMVFDDEPGTVYDMLRRLARWGLGGKMGHGYQFVSWIHHVDFCRAIEVLIDDPNADGIYNICAPMPVPNVEMMDIFRRLHGVPFGLPATKWMLEVGAFFLRTETELTVKSRRVVPERLMREGFRFIYPNLCGALAALQGRKNSAHSLGRLSYET